MRPHVSDGRRLSRCARGSHGSRSLHRASRTPSHETAPNLFGDPELPASEGARARDGLSWTTVVRCFGFEQRKHPLRTVGSPRGHQAALRFGQGLG